MLMILDDREEYGEDRWVGIALLRDPAVIVVYTAPDEETTRIISLRKALTDERAQY
ncbi:MAG: BrnT family toxin [Chloroflexota bacterium]|nr:BrnT family toxin [Chloroflexota bacterium]